jgi:hypothetical protein
MGACCSGLAGAAVASGYTLEGRLKLKRGVLAFDPSNEPAVGEEYPKSPRRLKGMGRSPTKTLLAGVLNL